MSRVPLGVGYLLHRINAMVAPPVQEDNETAMSFVVSVVPPPAADVTIDSITVSATSPLNVGDSLAGSISYGNVRVESGSGRLCFALFISHDDILDATDTRLGDTCVNRSTDILLVPGQHEVHSYSFVVPPLRADEFRIVAVANNGRTFPELNFDNNARWLSGTIAIDVPFLGPDPTHVLVAPGQRVLVRARAAGGVGLTISAVSNASAQDAFNKAWAKYDAVPSSSDFDVSHRDPFVASHVLRLDAPKEGDYYIVFEADSSATSPQNVSMTAENATFSLDSVSPTRFGRYGNVTLKLEGKELRPTMQVYLNSSTLDTNATNATTTTTTTTAAAVALYWFSSTACWATFNTFGLDAGTYSVVLVDGGALMAASPHNVTIIDGAPGLVEVKLEKCCEQGIRGGTINFVTVRWINTGDHDASAELLGLDVPDGLFRTLDYQNRQTWSTDKLRWMSVAEEGPAGILPPRASNERVIAFRMTIRDGTRNMRLRVERDSADVYWAFNLMNRPT